MSGEKETDKHRECWRTVASRVELNPSQFWRGWGACTLVTDVEVSRSVSLCVSVNTQPPPKTHPAWQKVCIKLSGRKNLLNLWNFLELSFHCHCVQWSCIFIYKQIKANSCLDNWPKNFTPENSHTTEIYFNWLWNSWCFREQICFTLNIYDLCLLKGDTVS